MTARKRTYQKLIGQDPDDLDANSALANLYERQYRKEKRAELLEASDQAIKRVLANGRATVEERTEALSLAGRNAKTQWREAFEGLSSVDERRKAAVNRQLIKAYDGYRAAYSTEISTISGRAWLRCKCARSRRAWLTTSRGKMLSTANGRRETRKRNSASPSTK